MIDSLDFMTQTKTHITRHCLAWITHPLMPRVLCAWILTYAIHCTIASQWLADFMQHSYEGPLGFNAFPVISLLGFLLLFVWHETRTKKTTKKRKKPENHSPLLFLVGVLYLVVTILIAYRATHPSLETFILRRNLLLQNPVLYEPVIASLMQWTLLLSIVPALMLLIPASVLRRQWKILLGGYTFHSFLIFSHVIEAFYFQLTAPTTISLTGRLLGLLPGHTTMQPERWELAYRNFAVTVGPVCSGFTMLILFIGLFAFLWTQLSKSKLFIRKRAIVAFSAGVIILYMLNIIRIASIMVVGSIAPRTAVDLFHSSIGAVLFFGLFLVYLKMVTPILIRSPR